MAEQVYVTHCLQSDSVRNETGFSIRAASTDDPDLLKFAADYPAYELPLDMWANEPASAQAPRRLALVPAPRGMLALIHSAYVGKDTMGRPGNFFTHTIFYPQLTAAAALESWGAGAWQTSYPSGAPKRLPALDDRPFKGGTLNAESLARFLSGKPVDRTAELATLLFPSRLHGDAQRAQALLARTLDAYLHASAAAAGERSRVYLLAEPGLVALLLYGVARLLPEDAAAGLTFSTYETTHKGLRQFKQAIACGSYLREPDKGLDQEYFRKRGYGLDTFVPDRCSPELAGDASEPAKFLVQEAAHGHWDVIAKLHECHGSGAVAVDSLNAAHELYRLFIRAQPNQGSPLTPEELLQLQRLPQGPALLRKHHALLWPTIYRCSRANASVSRAFAPAIRQHTSEMAQQAGRLLAARNPQWQEVWRLIKTADEAQEKRVERFVSLLLTAAQEAPGQPYVAGERITLLQQWQEIAAGSTPMPVPIRALLVVASGQEFEELWTANLPIEWLTVTLQAAFRRPGPEPWAIDVLGNERNDALTPAVVATLKDAHATPDLLSVLQRIVPDSKALPVLFRLLKHGLTVPPDVLDALLESCGGQKAVASRQWLKGDHLRRLLLMTAQYGKRADPICRRFCDLLAQPRLPSDQQQPLWQLLDQVRKQWPGAFPADCAQQLDDWALLYTLLTDPAQVTTAREAIDQACGRRGYKYTIQLLHEYYVAVIHSKAITDAAVSTFMEAFDTLAPTGDYIEDQRHRFRLWLKVISPGKEPRRADLELFYLERKVTLNRRQDIIDDDEVRGKLAASTVEAIDSMTNVRDGADAEAVPVDPKINSKSSRGAHAAQSSVWTAPLVVWQHSTWSQLGCLVAVLLFTLLSTAAISWGVGHFHKDANPQQDDSTSKKEPTAKEAPKADKTLPAKKSLEDKPVEPKEPKRKVESEPTDSITVKKADLAVHAASLRKLVEANPKAKELLEQLNGTGSGKEISFDAIKGVATKLANIPPPVVAPPTPTPEPPPPSIIANDNARDSLHHSLEQMENILKSDYFSEYLDPAVIKSSLALREQVRQRKLDPITARKHAEQMTLLAARIGKAEKPRLPKDIRNEAMRDFLKHAYSDELLKNRTYGITHGKPPNPQNVDLVMALYTAIKDAERAREYAALGKAVRSRTPRFGLPDLIFRAEINRIETELKKNKKTLDKAWQ
jgi:hypothetical protein